MPPTSSLIGLYGGSFDPVHRGHVATAEELAARLPFAEIRLLPAARSPLKPGSTASPHRLAMLQLALEGKQGLTIDDRELHRPPPSYTVDTLREIRAELGTGQPLAFIMGADSFAGLMQWKDWQALTDYAHLLVVSRPGSSLQLAPALENWLEKHRIAPGESLESRPRGKVLMVETRPHAIASREIRAALQHRGPDGQHEPRDTSGWLNPAVRDYIDRHHLYAGDSDPQ
jgi:nicotinate-nucleotide adenylyltransferase